MNETIEEKVLTFEEAEDFSFYLKAAFRVCQSMQWEQPVLRLEEVYDHIFRNNTGCEKCKKIFRETTKSLRDASSGEIKRGMNFFECVADIFVSCGNVNFDGRPVTFDEIWDHVTKEPDGCTRCNETYFKMISSSGGESEASNEVDESIPTLEEIAKFGIYLRDIHYSCPKTVSNSYFPSLQEAYNHAYLNDNGCERCRRVFARQTEHLRNGD